VREDAGVCETGGFESVGDRLHLIAEDTGENQPPTSSRCSSDARRRLDQDSLKGWQGQHQRFSGGPPVAAGILIVANRLPRRCAYPDCDRIRVHGHYSASCESFGGNRQNSRAGSEVKGSEVGGKDSGNVGEKSQARRRRGMLTGTKCHPSRNENAAHLRTALVPGAPSL
jgi:hypothetical protein